MSNPGLHALDLATYSAEGTRCLMCQRYCRIGEGQSGYCKTVVNRGGILYSTIYGLIAEYGADPIEKKPVRCYRPGTKVLSLGSFGCNLRCAWCQNWEIAFVDAQVPPAGQRYSPADVVAAAQRAGCAGIAWTYNEPSVWVDFIADCARLAHESGLYTVLVTNGMFSSESLCLLAPLIDVYRADFKSLDQQIYQNFTHLSTNDPILSGIRFMHQAGVHVELVTVLMPILDAEHVARMASWIVEELGQDVPWHLPRFVPYAQLPNLAPTSARDLAQARVIAQTAGLKRVFVGDWYEIGTYD